MCLTKSGESGKDGKGVAAQKDKRERNLCVWNFVNSRLQMCSIHLHSRVSFLTCFKHVAMGNKQTNDKRHGSIAHDLVY